LVPGLPAHGGVKLRELTVSRQRSGGGFAGPSVRGAGIAVVCRRGCRSKALRVKASTTHIRYLEGRTLVRGTKFVVRVTRGRPAARGPEWTVTVDGNARFHVASRKYVWPDLKGALYTGITKQGASSCGDSNDRPCAVLVRVSKSGKQVHEFVYFTAACTDGNVLTSSTVFDSVGIAKGRYSFSGTYDETFSDGSTATDSVQTSGKFRIKEFRVTGSYRVDSDVTFTDGTQTHCASGRVTFTARRK
jgi:hypothetical protein